MFKKGDHVMFNDGDDTRLCRVVDVDPLRYQVETPTQARLWVRHTTWRLTPTHHQHRAGDRPTAVAAARQVKAGTGKYKVLAALYHAPHGMIDHEHVAASGLIATSAGKRRLELMTEFDPPLVEDSGTTRPTPSGEQATVWRLTEAGFKYAALTVAVA